MLQLKIKSYSRIKIATLARVRDSLIVGHWRRCQEDWKIALSADSRPENERDDWPDRRLLWERCSSLRLTSHGLVRVNAAAAAVQLQPQQYESSRHALHLIIYKSALNQVFSEFYLGRWHHRHTFTFALIVLRGSLPIALVALDLLFNALTPWLGW